MQENIKTILRKQPFWITGTMALLAILLAMFIGGVLMFFIDIPPVEAYHYFFYGVLGSTYGFGEMLSKFVPLLCCAMAFSVAQKSGFFNLGAEGQLNMGALSSVVVASVLPEMPAVFAISISILAGIVGGALLSTLAGLLKIFFGANELLVTMMLNYIMTYVIALLVSGILKNPESSMEHTAPIPEYTELPIILEGSRLHAGLFIALAAVVVVWFIQQRTTIGYEMRLSGMNSIAARYAGVNGTRALITVIIISGAIAGLGGALELQGNQYKLINHFSSGFGFDGIGIAVMGQYHPVGIILSALLFAALRVGTASMQRGMDVPTPMLYILQGSIVIAIIVSNYFVKKIQGKLVEGRAS